ncbi:synaptonemal complex central element protein 1 isoform X2 [Denticeps clupeoides]|uniref:synaptonemal complex central element protein 1 isoform X2 n=1 Tax=Denticeps clupeoides TaxID=299321 RepID=UPI0010A41363|nr:synaptonemal complex central element protein 1-like isoform X2 [Denticeps clupeoides]
MANFCLCLVAERPEPKVEQLVAELRRLQRVKRTLEEEVTTSQALGDTLRGQWEALCSEAFCLEGTLKEKEGSCGVLRFKCEELEQEAQRQRAQNQEKEELLELYRCQIEETKLRHRKARLQPGCRGKSPPLKMLLLSCSRQKS